MSRSRSSRRPKTLAVAGLVVAVVGVGGAAMAFAAQEKDGPAAAATSTSVPSPVSPTTVSAVAPSSTSANVPAPDPDDVATDTATPDGVSVQITYAGADDAAGGVVVGAYVAGLVEEGGTCSLTLTQEGRVLSAESPGSPSASTTSCGQMLVPGAPSGSWVAEVTYTSPAGGAGVRASGSMTVEVP